MPLPELEDSGKSDSCYLDGFCFDSNAEQYNVPLELAMETFFNSNAYKFLSDKETGYYFDSIPEIFDIFVEEVNRS